MTTNVSRQTRPLQRFASELGRLWPQVAPLCIDLGADDLSDLLADTRRTARESDPRLRLLAGDLEALLAGWQHFEPDKRALLRGAISYLEHDMTAPETNVTPAPADPARADTVVGAAVRTLLRC